MKARYISSVLLLCLGLGNAVCSQAGGAIAPCLVPAVENPALPRFISETLHLHPEVAAARAALDASDAREQAAARPAFNPDLELAADSSVSDQRTIGISQTFEVAGQRAARTAVAGFEHEAARASLAAARRDLARELLGALADFHLAEARDDLMQRHLEIMKRFAELALRRHRAGDLTQVDLAAARLALAKARIEKANAAGARAGAEQALRTLVPARVKPQWPELPTMLPPVTLEQAQYEAALSALPEIRVQRAGVSAAMARADLLERERRPNPTLGLQGGQEDGQPYVGLSFSIPLRIRNRFTAEIAAARADQRQVERQAENVEARAEGRLLAATERYRLTRDAWDGWVASGEPNLTEQTVLLERLWEAGDLSLTDYLVQLNQTFDTAVSALDLRRELWRAWFEWLAAGAQLGTWLDEPIE